jgi:hypothetical protein
VCGWQVGKAWRTAKDRDAINLRVNPSSASLHDHKLTTWFAGLFSDDAYLNLYTIPS